MSEGARGFSCEPDPENPGWHRWRLLDETRYNEAVLGRMLVRREDEDSARCRIIPVRHLTNNGNNVHGAATLGLIDVSLFAGMHMVRGVDAMGSATVDLSCQFIGSGDPEKPLDAVVQVLRETRRLGFLRGLIVQGEGEDESIVASFTGTVRKPSAPIASGR
ncbi:PaaI family thioesterase [Novosphingobium sp. JCM 18896]|uniref:PaaI family thioesterase n=1 Tax=Novosphingobium sp. JCM 18896 TaxID=2989731 RepID=UPI0022225D1A|nr:PaaI family thioesterase [Novosphingobium sp. JCM 18896]MCW1428159.1 PaaI family thioesterase [Novosphingobium sp. JCM 18896]